MAITIDRNDPNNFNSIYEMVSSMNELNKNFIEYKKSTESFIKSSPFKVSIQEDIPDLFYKNNNFKKTIDSIKLISDNIEKINDKIDLFTNKSINLKLENSKKNNIQNANLSNSSRSTGVNTVVTTIMSKSDRRFFKDSFTEIISSIKSQGSLFNNLSNSMTSTTEVSLMSTQDFKIVEDSLSQIIDLLSGVSSTDHDDDRDKKNNQEFKKNINKLDDTIHNIDIRNGVVDALGSLGGAAGSILGPIGSAIGGVITKGISTVLGFATAELTKSFNRALNLRVSKIERGISRLYEQENSLNDIMYEYGLSQSKAANINRAKQLYQNQFGYGAYDYETVKNMTPEQKRAFVLPYQHMTAPEKRQYERDNRLKAVQMGFNTEESVSNVTKELNKWADIFDQIDFSSSKLFSDTMRFIDESGQVFDSIMDNIKTISTEYIVTPELLEEVSSSYSKYFRTITKNNKEYTRSMNNLVETTGILENAGVNSASLIDQVSQFQYSDYSNAASNRMWRMFSMIGMDPTSANSKDTGSLTLSFAKKLKSYFSGMGLSTKNASDRMTIQTIAQQSMGMSPAEMPELFAILNGKYKKKKKEEDPNKSTNKYLTKGKWVDDYKEKIWAEEEAYYETALAPLTYITKDMWIDAKSQLADLNDPVIAQWQQMDQDWKEQTEGLMGIPAEIIEQIESVNLIADLASAVYKQFEGPLDVMDEKAGKMVATLLDIYNRIPRFGEKIEEVGKKAQEFVENVSPSNIGKNILDFFTSGKARELNTAAVNKVTDAKGKFSWDKTKNTITEGVGAAGNTLHNAANKILDWDNLSVDEQAWYIANITNPQAIGSKLFYKGVEGTGSKIKESDLPTVPQEEIDRYRNEGLVGKTITDLGGRDKIVNGFRDHLNDYNKASYKGPDELVNHYVEEGQNLLENIKNILSPKGGPSTSTSSKIGEYITSSVNGNGIEKYLQYFSNSDFAKLYRMYSDEEDESEGSTASSHKTNPIKGYRITSGYGSRKDPFNPNRMDFHEGIDLDMKSGTGIKAYSSGVIDSIGYNSELGNYIVLQGFDGYRYKLGHLSQISVNKGDEVKEGQLIGMSGNTGKSTGPHLHIEVIDANNNHIDPKKFFNNDYMKLASEQEMSSNSVNANSVPVNSSKSSMASITGSTAEENAHIVYSFFKKAGMADTNIAGILGNWGTESGIDSTGVEGVYNEPYSVTGTKKSSALKDLSDYTLNKLFPMYKNKKINKEAYKGTDGKYYAGIGIGQFTGPRSEALLNQYGSNWYTLGSQLEYMSTSDSRAGFIKDWMSSPEATPEEAAKIFLNKWEGNKNDKLAQRQETAKTYYELMKTWKIDEAVGNVPDGGQEDTDQTDNPSKESLSLDQDSTENSVVLNVSDKRQGLIDYVTSKLDLPYVWGAEGPDSFDCSGLVTAALKSVNMLSGGRLSTSDMRGSVVQVSSVNDLTPGDILMGNHGKHTGIYVGNNTIIHASGSQSNPDKVKTSEWSPYWYGKYTGLGAYEQGGVISKPTMSLMGEGGYNEYVISTDPRYKERSTDLVAQLSKEMGLDDFSDVTNSASSKYMKQQNTPVASSILNALENRVSSDNIDDVLEAIEKLSDTVEKGFKSLKENQTRVVGNVNESIKNTNIITDYA